ncbi:MAG TPA: subclass B3 metallo-beta-lactamase [Xanthomonadaceae bacterium]|jgi:metallo-beta-lactamase class B|nr:subclass B3 metallo-beta-lactamase [Xanthomonadaceae bacterium]
MLALFAFAALASAGATTTTTAPDEAPIHCDDCADWNQPQAPFRIFGNTWYVGVQGLSSVLVVTRDGLILFDGDLPQSAHLIAENIRTLGFDIHSVRWILNSHAHSDHTGGIAALQRMSGAKVGASMRGAQALRAGDVPADDPLAADEPATRFPPVAHVQAFRDGDTIALGGVTITAHATPGHTPGGTTWTWRSCEGARCADIVYADSLNAISAAGFRYSDSSRSPTTADILRHSIATVRALPCDILISVHPGVSDVLDKAAANARDPSKNAFLDPGSCRAYADYYEQSLDARLLKERGTAAH